MHNTLEAARETGHPGTPPPHRLAILQRNELDCDALAALFQAQPDWQLVGATMSLKSLFNLCGQLRPAVVLVDAKYPSRSGDIVEHSATLIRDGKARSVLFLDEMPNNLRAIHAASNPWYGYATRSVTTRRLLTLLRALTNNELADSSPGNWQPAAVRPLQGKPPGGGSALAELTPKELQVFYLLARGLTAKACADALHLSASTIENHRSRILKKLNVNNSVQLTLLAIREGLISA